MRRPLALALALGLLASILGLQLASADVTGPGVHQSAHLWPSATVPYNSDATRQVACDMYVNGQDTLTIGIPLYQAGPQATKVTRRVGVKDSANTPTDAELVGLIRNAHRCGLAHVALQPYLELPGGEWRAHVHFAPSQAAQAKLWRASWNWWLRHYATLGKAEGVTMIVVGTEMRGVMLTEYNDARLGLQKYNPNNPQEWITAIGQVRKIDPKMRVVYAAHMTSESRLIDPAVGRALDGFGITYYPKTDQQHPTPASLKAQMALDRKNYFVKLWDRYHRPILVMEVGFRSIVWSDRTLSGDQQMKGAHPDEKLQAMELKAALETLAGYEHIRGVDYYRWLNTPDAGGPRNADFTVQNKLAEDVWAAAMGGRSTKYMIRQPWPIEDARLSAPTTVKARLTGATTPPRANYSMRYRVDGGAWVAMRDEPGGTLKVAAVRPSTWKVGTHYVQTQAIDLQGRLLANTVRQVTRRA